VGWSYVAKWAPSGAYPNAAPALSRQGGVGLQPGDDIVLFVQWASPLAADFVAPAGFSRIDSDYGPSQKSEIWHMEATAALGSSPTFSCGFSQAVSWSTLEAHAFRGGVGQVGQVAGARQTSGTVMTSPGVTTPYAGCALINSYLARRAAGLPPIVGPRASGIISHDDDAAPIAGMGRDISWAQLASGGFTPDRTASSGSPIVQAQSTSIVLLGPAPPPSQPPAVTGGPAAYYGPTWTRTGPLNTPWFLFFTADDPNIPGRSLAGQVRTGPGRSGTLVAGLAFLGSDVGQAVLIARDAPGLQNGNQTLYFTVDNSPNAGPGLVSQDYPFALKRDDQAAGGTSGFANPSVQADRSWSLTTALQDDLSSGAGELRWEIRTGGDGSGATLASGRATAGQAESFAVQSDPSVVVGVPADRWIRWYDGAGNPQETRFQVYLDPATAGFVTLSYGGEPRVEYAEAAPFQATRIGPNSMAARLRATLAASPAQEFLWQVRTGAGLSSGQLVQNGGYGPGGEPGTFGTDTDDRYPVLWTNPSTAYTFPDGDRVVYLIAYNPSTLQQSNALPFTVLADQVAAPGASSGAVAPGGAGWRLSATLYDNLSTAPGELHWELRTQAAGAGALLASGTATSGAALAGDFVPAPPAVAYLRFWDGALNPHELAIQAQIPQPNTPPTLSAGPVGYGACSRTGPGNPSWTLRLTAADQEQASIQWDLRTGPGGGGTSVASGSAQTGAQRSFQVAYNAPGLTDGDNHLYLRASDGQAFSNEAQVLVRRDDSWPPNWFQVGVGDSDGSGYDLSFTATDDLSLDPGEIRWEWRDASDGGGALLAGGTATSGQQVAERVAEPSVGQRWLRVFDGACNPAEREFSVEAAPAQPPPFGVPPRGCGRSVLYDAPAATQQTGGQPRAQVNLCDRVPSGKYVVSRAPRPSLGQLSQQVNGHGLRGVVLKLSSFSRAPGWSPSLQGEDWQVHQAQLLADQLPGQAVGSQLAGAQTLRAGGLVIGGLFELGRDAFESPSLAARAVAHARNRLNLDFVMIDITDEAWKGRMARSKALALFQHVQGQYVRSRHGPRVPRLSQHCPTFAVLPPATAGWGELLSADGCFEPFVNGYSGPATFAAPRVPAGSTSLAAAWQWCRPWDESGRGIGRAELVVDVRNGQSPGATVDLAVTDGAVTVTFPQQRTNWTPRSGLVVYDDLDALSAHGPEGADPSGYWEYDGLNPLEGAVVPVYDPDPFPPIVAGAHFGSAPGTVPAPGGGGSSLSFPPEVEQHRAAVAAVFPAGLVNKALWTVQHESGGLNVQQSGGGPGTGIFQMEACTYPWGFVAYAPCPPYRPLTVGDGLARPIPEQVQAAYDLLLASDAGGVDPNGKEVFYPWGELPGGNYQTGWGSFRAGFPYDLDGGGSPEAGPSQEPPAGLPAPGGSPRIYVSTENWKTGHLGDSHFPQWAEVATPDCAGARGTRRLADGWLELNGIRPLSEPHGTPLPDGQLVLSGTPLPGDDGQLPLFIEVRRSQSDGDLRTKFTLILPVADPARMRDTAGVAPSGIPISRPAITEIVDVAGALHSHAPRKSGGRIPEVWESAEEWCLGATTPAAEIPAPRGTPGARPPPGSGGGAPAASTGCPCEAGFTMTAGCAWHQAVENLQAIDVGVPGGTAVYATCGGVVSYRDWDQRYGPNPPLCAYRDWDGTILGFLPCGYGVMMSVDCDDGQTSMRYGHLDQSMPTSSAFPAVGDHVSAGQQIAVSDNTGFSTGPHLHYEVRVNGVTVCPENLVPAGCVS
jgi:hypothetical protein